MGRGWLVGVFAFSFSMGCGPSGSQSTATDGETETDGSESSGGSTAVSMTSTTGPVTSETVTTAMPTTVPPPTMTSVGTDPDTTTTEGCPPGTEGCPCDVGSTCVDDLVCVDGVCEAATPCEDTDDEPNDDLDSATTLPDAVCGGEPGMSAGVLADVDLDFYTFGEAPLGVCFGVEPTVQTDGDDDLEVCVFLDCAGQEVGTVDCGAQEAADLNGLPGCCGTNGASFEGHDCGFGGVTGPDYIIRIGPGVAGQCTAYDLEYRLN